MRGFGKQYLYPLFSYLPLVLLVGLWEIAAQNAWVNPLFLPPPSEAVSSLIRLFQDGILIPAILASLWRIIVGFSLAAVVGIVCAIASAANVVVRRNLTPIVEVLRPFAPVGWIPLAILWFDQPAFFIVFIAAVFQVFVYTTFGLLNVPQSALLAAKTFGATRWQTLRHVVVPAMLPSLFTGLRLGIGLAWMSLIAAELFAVQSGLGYQIELSRLSAAPQDAIALMFVVGILGLLMSAGMAAIERRVMPWRKTLTDVDIF